MPASGSIYERFERAAAAQPERLAIDALHESWTYGVFAHRASAIATGLAEAGVGPGDRVVLLFEREPEACAALFAVLKIGAIAVPLTASHPHERLRHLLDDADAAAVLTNHRHVAHAHTVVGRRVPVFEVEPLMARPEAGRTPAATPANSALILYTSGSTGTPKGVLQSHRFILGKLDRIRPILQCQPDDRVTLFSSYALGQGSTTIFMTLLSGATLCPFDVRRDGLGPLPRWIEEHRVTIYLSSATLLRSVMRTLDGGRSFPSLRLIRIGGERVHTSDIESARRLFPCTQTIVNYSCTETGPIAMYPVEDGDAFADGIVPVGRPLHGVSVRIVDDAACDLPAGTVGEIAVQSTLSTEYWRDPERTALASGAVPNSDERLHRTGDLGRFRHDGLLEHLGRKDLRVKIRGFRIEIEEVEKVLNQDPNVRLAAVAAKDDANGDLRLVAYVQPVPGADVTVEGLRALMSVRLPEHMIPSLFVLMDQLPLTDSNKIARYLLPDPPPDRAALAAPSVAPRSALEAAVAGVWREVLGLETVGVHDAFLAIGGDSLKATLVASRLATQFGVEVPLWVLFEASTVAELTMAVERQLLQRTSM